MHCRVRKRTPPEMYQSWDRAPITIGKKNTYANEEMKELSRKWKMDMYLIEQKKKCSTEAVVLRFQMLDIWAKKKKTFKLEHLKVEMCTGVVGKKYCTVRDIKVQMLEQSNKIKLCYQGNFKVVSSRVTEKEGKKWKLQNLWVDISSPLSEQKHSNASLANWNEKIGSSQLQHWKYSQKQTTS